jgi:hypothetical protein
LTLDFNHTRSFAELLNDAVDAALTDENAKRPRREYLGGSRVGHACERALQFEFAGAPKDEGADFPGQTLRIFAIGHALEDLAIQWLRTAGLDLCTRKGIPGKLAHLVRYLGTPTLTVESGGRTTEGATKLHVWWKLTEAATGADLATLCRLRGDIALKVGGDTHFRSALQPIRVAGSVYHKGGFQRLVQIRDHHPIEVELANFAEQVAAMPALPGVGVEPTPEASTKPSLEAILTTPVHEGGADHWTRFEGASAAIGHYVRLVHDGKMTPNDGWEAICQYNAAMLRPAWPAERLQQEADRHWALHVRKNGPALLRNDTDQSASPVTMPAYRLRELLADKSPMPDDIIAPRVLTPGGLLVLGGAPKVGKSDFLISLLVHMAADVAFLGFTPNRAVRVYYLQAEIQYHYLRERLQGIRLDAGVIAAALDNLIATPKLRPLLDERGIALAAASIQEHFPDAPPDIICIDPIRNLFDGGKDGGGENDNAAMMFFLTERVERLREAVAPDCGIILAQPHATARDSAHCDHSSDSAKTRWSMSASLCSGVGVMRSRSVPRGTVG